MISSMCDIIFVKIKFCYPLLISQCKFEILDFGFWIGGIAALYSLIKIGGSVGVMECWSALVLDFFPQL
jgi:hypothetical protein